MSNRHRLPYAALGGFLAVILWAGLTLAQEPQEVGPPVSKSQPKTESGKQPSKSGAANQAQKKEPAPEKLSPSLNRIESAIRELVNQQRAAQEKGPAQHEIKDLEAQDDMAFWAKLMFFATMVAVGLTGFGIWLIKRTLDETKVAAKHTEGMLEEAKKTTEAAHAAIQATDKNAERQLRAYVVIATETKWAAVGDVNKPTAYAFTIRWDNAGITPARRGRSSINTDTFDKDIPADFDYPDPPRDKRPDERFTERSHIGPKKYVESTVTIPKSDVQAAERHNKRVFVWGWFEYNDIFNGTPRHRTEICLEIIIGAGARTCMVTITGPFNGADEDCLHKAKT